MPRLQRSPGGPRAAALALLVPALLLGSALLPACTDEGDPGPASTPTLVSITLAPGAMGLEAGGTAQLAVTGNRSDGATADLTAAAAWSSAPAGVLSVAAGGLATALAAGEATVTATVTVGDVTRTAQATVTVTGAEEPPPGGYDPGAGWTLTWADEFNGAAVDPASWTFDLGSGGWGNNESEWYRAENAEVAGGLLTITARKEDFGDAPYTSARMQTSQKRAFTYGKISMRARLPYGQGIWPAFWMLGANSSAWGLYGGDVAWPGCGEIDVMEMIGGLADGSGDYTTHGTLHYLDATGRNPAPSFALRLPEKLTEDFHVYELVWTPHSFTWKLDGVAFGTQVIGEDMEEFHRPMFLLLNLAVGGAWGGWVDGTTVFPQEFVVDWVRVYDNATTEPGGEPGLATTWHLTDGAAVGIAGAEALSAAQGGVTGFQPTKLLGAASTWFGPPLTGTFDEGAWSVGLFTTSPTGAARVRAEVFVTAADGGAPRLLGAAEVDPSKTGMGHHMSWLRLTGVPAQTLANERLKVVVTQLSGPEITLIYNGNDFDSRLTTPWSAAP